MRCAPHVFRPPARTRIRLQTNLRDHVSPGTTPLKPITVLLFAVAIALILGIYSYPALRTTAVTGSRLLPPISAPDPSLYLNISTIKSGSAEIVDPYYGVALPAARLGYLKFRLAFLMFGRLHQLLGGNLWWSMLVWNWLWWAALSVAVVWLFRQFLPDASPALVVMGLSLVMLFNFGVLQNQISAWLHPGSLRGFRDVVFPYIRSFFPQVPIPLVVVYLILQIRALQSNRLPYWVAMGLIQLIAFMIFPYAMLMMAGISLVSVIAFVWPGRWQNRPLPLTRALLFAFACGIADLFFVFHGNQTMRSGAPGQYALVHLQVSLLPHRIGGMWMILAALTAGLFFIRDLAPEIRWPIAGLALTNLFFLLGDAFFSETTLQVSHHAGYFVHTTASILFMFLMSAGIRRFHRFAPQLRWALMLCGMFLLINGALVAHATYLQFLPGNQELAQLANSLRSAQPQSDDLVVARSLNVDDDCAWVSLLTPSHVLYCRNVQVLMSPEQNQQIQRFRQALYLYFTGKDPQWLEAILANSNNTTELTRLTFLGQVTVDAAGRQQGIDAVRKELIPRLETAEHQDPDATGFFSHYRRVLVIDNLDQPYFAESRLSSYLAIQQRQTVGRLLILTCTPLSK